MRASLECMKRHEVRYVKRNGTIEPIDRAIILWVFCVVVVALIPRAGYGDITEPTPIRL